MRMRVVATGLAAAVMVGAGAHGEDALALQPGEYEVTVRLELRHVAVAALKLATICLTTSAADARGLVALSDNNPLARCPASNVRQDGQVLTFDIICPGGNQAVASARFTLAQRSFVGIISMKMGGKNMTMTEHQVGRRIGNCGT